VELQSLAEVEIEVVNEKGEKEVRRVDAEEATVIPGDTVIFTTTYINKGKEAADNVVIKNPVPKHMTYVDFSAEGDGTTITFSVDGGKSFDFVANLKVKDRDGRERRAVASDYTDISWVVERGLKPAGKGSVAFRARLK